MHEVITAVSKWPKISIIMPVLNREHTIEKAIRSLIAQDYPDVEFIVIDGGSTDGTVNIIKGYEKYISYWHSKADGGASIAMNLGVEQASGDLVAFLMADDWYEPETLKKIGKAMMDHPEADVITCGGKIVYYDTDTNSYKPKHIYASARRMELNFSNVCFDITSAICCRFIRKSLYDQIGLFLPYDSQGKHMFSNDKEFLLRAILHGAKNIYVDYVGHNYLASKDSSTFGNHKQNILRLCHEHMETAEIYLKTKPMSAKYTFLFMYWYIDQSTRLVLFNILDGNFRKSLTLIKDGVSKFPLMWAPAFVYTTFKIIIKKTVRLMAYS